MNCVIYPTDTAGGRKTPLNLNIIVKTSGCNVNTSNNSQDGMAAYPFISLTQSDSADLISLCFFYLC